MLTLSPGLRRRAEAAAYALIGLALLLRYPIHFAQSGCYLMDFNVYRAVAERVLTGAAVSLYAPTTPDTDMMVFKYAPVWAIIMAPLGWLPASAGAIAWLVVSVCALVAALVACADICRRSGWRYAWWTGVAALVLVVRTLGEEMGNGQCNLLWAALFTGSIAAFVRRRLWLGAGLLSAAILLKLPAVLMLGCLALTGRRAMAWRTALLTAAAAVAGSALLRPGEPLALLTRWAEALAANGSAYAFMVGNQSLLALLARFLTADGYGVNLADLPRAAIPPLWAGLTLLGFALVVRRGRRPPQEPARLALDAALIGVLMVVCSPSGFLATYAALIAPAFFAIAGIGHQLSARRRDWPAALLGVAVILLSALTHRKVWWLIGMRTAWRGEAYLFMVFMILPWMALALFALLLRLRGRVFAPAARVGTSGS
jgi:hypothetical protein